MVKWVLLLVWQQVFQLTNLSEIVDATVELINNPEAKLEDLMKHVKGPDFPTGAVVYGGAPMIQAYRNWSRKCY